MPIQFLLYNMPDADGKVQVVIRGETLWCTQKAMAQLFGIGVPAISKHLKNIFEEGELDKKVVVFKMEITTQHGAMEEKTQTHNVDFYSLDAIIAVGYRVSSLKASRFRQWATKILKKYLEQRTDANPALFVSLRAPHTRLTISGVEVRLRQLGKKVNLNKVHPYKFRRTLATMAIDKGMPIEQVQKMLGHVKIDTTLHYAMVNQANVKMAHRKYIN